MAKSKVAPTPPAPQEAQGPRTIPLSDITITEADQLEALEGRVYQMGRPARGEEA